MFFYNTIYLVTKDNTLMDPLMLILLFVDFGQLLSFAASADGAQTHIFTPTVAKYLRYLRLLPAFSSVTYLTLYSAAVTVVLALVVAVAFFLTRRLQMNRIPPINLIRALRLVLLLLLTALAVPVSSAFTQTMSQQFHGVDTTYIQWTVIIAVSIVQVAFIAATLSSLTIFFNPDRARSSLLTKSTARADVYYLAAKLIIVSTSAVAALDGFAQYTGLVTVVGCILFGTCFLVTVITLPYHSRLMNTFKASVYLVLFVIHSMVHSSSTMSFIPPWLTDITIIVAVLLAPPVCMLICCGMEVLYSIPVRAFVAQPVAERGGIYWLASDQVDISIRFLVRRIRAINAKIAHRTQRQPASIPGFGDGEELDLTILHDAREAAVDELYRVFQWALRRYPASLKVNTYYMSCVRAFRPLLLSDCTKRAERIAQEPNVTHAFDVMFFYFVATKSRTVTDGGSSASNNEVARLERQRQLRMTAKDEKAYRHEGTAFWSKVAFIKQRRLTRRRFQEVLITAEHLARTAGRIERNYSSLLHAATPRIIRQYAGFLSANGMEALAQPYLSQADDLEATHRETVGMQTVHLDGRRRAWLGLSSSTEVRALACVLLMAVVVIIISVVCYITLSVVFVNLLWSFFNVDMLASSLLLSSIAAIGYMATEEPAMVIAIEQPFKAFYSALVNNADQAYIRDGIALYEEALPIMTLTTSGATDDHITRVQALVDAMPSAAPFAESLATPAIQAMSRLAGADLAHTVLDWPGLVLRTDCGLLPSLAMLGGESVPGPGVCRETGASLTEILTFIQAKIGSLAAYGVNATITDSMRDDASDILANVAQLLPPLVGGGDDMLDVLRGFPLKLAAMMAIAMVLFAVLLAIIVGGIFFRSVSQSVGAQLDILRIILRLPDVVIESFTRSHRPMASRQLTHARRTPAITFDLPDHQTSDPKGDSDDEGQPRTEEAKDGTPRTRQRRWSLFGRHDITVETGTAPALACWAQSRRAVQRDTVRALLPGLLCWSVVLMTIMGGFVTAMMFRMVENTTSATHASEAAMGGLQASKTVGIGLRLVWYESVVGESSPGLRAGFQSALDGVGDLGEMLAGRASSHFTEHVKEDLRNLPEFNAFGSLTTNLLGKLVQNENWVSGTASLDMLDVLYNPRCPALIKASLPESCTPRMGGNNTAVSEQAQQGFMSAISGLVTLGMAMLDYPLPSKADDPVGFDTTMAKTRDLATQMYAGMSASYLPYGEGLLAAFRTRINTANASLWQVFVMFVGLMFIGLAILHLQFFRRAAAKIQLQQDQIAGMLDGIYRAKRDVLDEALQADIVALRPHLIDPEIAD